MGWLIRIVLGLMVLAVAAVLLLVMLPADRIARLVTDQFQAATGRAMTLEGDPRPTLWPELGIRTGPVSVANADWASDVPLLQAGSLSVGVDMLALLRGEVHIRGIEIEGPVVVLERAADGRGNWELGDTSGGSGAEAGGLPDFTLDTASVKNGSFRFIDHGAGSQSALGNIDATLQLPDIRGKAVLDLSATLSGQDFRLDASIDGVEDFLLRGAVPVALDLLAGGSAVRFEGKAGLAPLAAGGWLDADLRDPGAVLGLAGLAFAELPEGLGRTMAVRGDVTFTETGGVTLRDGTIRLDHNTLTGALDVSLDGRPKIIARLGAGALDLSALTGGTGAEAAPESAGWSRDRIDVSGLQAVDAEIALAAASVDLGVMQLGKTVTLTRLDAGRAVTEISELAAYGGALSGTFVINSRGGLSARANLDGTGLALQPLLQDLADYDRLLATGDLALNLLAVGDDMATLMGSLSGDGSIRFGKGELRGLDLVGMLRHLDTSYVGEGARTIFDSIDGTFTADKGVLSNSDLRMTAPLFNADGKGTVDIGKQTLDYRVAAALLEGEQNGGLRVPLMITGPWAKPRFRLDLEALAEQELKDDVEELRDKAETVVKEKLKEELGVEVETLENVDDVLKQELEDRLREGVLDLLGGQN